MSKNPCFFCGMQDGDKKLVKVTLADAIVYERSLADRSNPKDATKHYELENRFRKLLNRI